MMVLASESFSSRNFSHVPATLNAVHAKTLIHRAAGYTDDAADAAFSANRRHAVSIVNLPSRVISMTIGWLEAGQSTRLHRHNYETLIYVVRGHGVSRIEGSEVDWRAGDAFYVPVWTWHQHRNNGTESAQYVACENAPALQNLGIALREEHPDG